MIRDFWSLHLARKTYACGEDYYGTFPEGFEKKIIGLGVIASPFVHLCSGLSELGEYRFDINQKTKATHFQDARDTGLPNEFASFVLIDCYYTPADFEKQKQKPVSVYEFWKEAMRITKVGGSIAVLHTLPPRKPKGTELTHLIAISTGPDRQFRCLQIFKKLSGFSRVFDEQKASRNPESLTRVCVYCKTVAVKENGVWRHLYLKQGGYDHEATVKIAVSSNPESLSTECQTKALIATYEKKKVRA
jgi:hypothetical protein